MFTGLIEEVGTLRRAERQGEAMLLTIAAAVVLEDVKLGDSIAVNGVCLTVVAASAAEFTVDVVPQTYRHSNLGQLRPGQPVNLERAMAAGGRFGGHIVQGHADTTGTITARTREDNAVRFGVRPAGPEAMRYIVPQGSICIDGISLTVAGVDGETLEASIIPHTLAHTALQHKQPGDTVNLELDILGKYVDHLLRYGSASPNTGKSGGLSAAFLAEHGFA
ncbi:riboflavin synthase [Paenibacillus sp. IB182496]|uniref:Riboflavin synthase n=1 Tax=Paenibacillus sabuli TaxID=2772509 RepID=A0A927BWJ4_9BACL|nr:riboflavin synthase [Paenibacillus sabuli]MBD2846814.1 riboflavin synthase [Paenibacillus sabuli]